MVEEMKIYVLILLTFTSQCWGWWVAWSRRWRKKWEMYMLSALALLLLPLLQQVSISQETSCTHRFCRLQLKGTVEMLSGGCATPQGLTLLRSYWNFNKTDISKDKPVIFHCQLYYWLKTHQFILLGVQHLFTDFSTVAFYSSCSRISNQHMPWNHFASTYEPWGCYTHTTDKLWCQKERELTQTRHNQSWWTLLDSGFQSSDFLSFQ